MLNAENLKIRIKAKAHENNLNPQDIMQMYFFERLLYRISKSKYKTNFILKVDFCYRLYLAMSEELLKIWIQ